MTPPTRSRSSSAIAAFSVAMSSRVVRRLGDFRALAGEAIAQRLDCGVALRELHIDFVLPRRALAFELTRLFGDLRFELRVQPLDRRERDAVGIDGRDRPLVRADGERPIEVLRHRADVHDARRRAVTPARYVDRQRLGQHVLWIDRVHVDLRCRVAGHVPRPVP